MRQLSTVAQTWIAAVLLGGGLVIAIAALQVDRPEVRAEFTEPALWLLLAGAAIAHAFPVIAPRHQAYHATQAFLMASVLVLAWPCVVVIVVVAHVAEWVRRPRPLYIQLYNVAAYVLAAGAAYALLSALGVGDFGYADARSIVVALVAAAVMVFVNHGLTAVVLWLARGVRPTDSGVFGLESLGLDGLLMVVGIGVAGGLRVQPFSIVITASPLILIYRALRVANVESTSHRDQLTGLYNARHLQDALAVELRRAVIHAQPTGLFVVVLDDLPTIVQRYGRATLDFIVLAVAERLRLVLRDFDLIARLDEGSLGVLAPSMERGQLAAIARTSVERLSAQPFSVATTREPVIVTASLAYACVPPAPGDAAPELLSTIRTAADRAALSGPRAVTEVPVALETATARRAAPGQLGSSQSVPASVIAPWLPPRDWLIRYVAAVCALGLGVSVAVLLTSPLPDVLLGAGVLALVVLSELLAFELYDRSSFSVSFAPIVAAGLLGGPAATLLAVWCVALARGLLRRSEWQRVVFNASAFTLCGVPALIVATGAGRFHVDTDQLGPLALGTAAAAGVYYLHTFLIAGALALQIGADPREVWARNYRWLFPHYVVLGWMGLGLAVATVELGPLGTALFVAPPLAMRVVLKQYVERTAGAVHRLEAANADLRAASMLLQQRGHELALLSDLGQMVAAEPRTETLPALVVQRCAPSLGELCAIVWHAGEGIHQTVHTTGDPAADQVAAVVSGLTPEDTARLADGILHGRPTDWSASSGGCWLATPLAGMAEPLGWFLAWTHDALGEDERARRLELMRQVAQRVALVLERDALLEEAAEVEALRTVDRAKSDFIATTAHELRTPLTSLRGYTELLRNPVDPALRDRWLSIVQLEAAQLGQVVDQLLDVSRLDSGRFQAERREFELRDIVNRVVEHFAPEAELSGHHLAVVVPDTMAVFGDPSQVDRVLRNLLSNAIKYSPGGGPITLAAMEGSQGEVEVCVEDSGLGIPPEWLGRLFERFQRVERPERASIRGTGLGLYIARQLVELNAGHIWVTSDGEGQGSTFHFTLPLGPRDHRR